MSIGKMRFEVELQKPTNTRDAGGGLTESFTTLSNLYANIEPVRGNETLKQGQVKEQTTHLITIRYRRCLLYTSPSPRDYAASRMPSSA